jgi:hypothetical protein
MWLVIDGYVWKTKRRASLTHVLRSVCFIFLVTSVFEHLFHGGQFARKFCCLTHARALKTWACVEG